MDALWAAINNFIELIDVFFFKVEDHFFLHHVLFAFIEVDRAFFN